MATSGVLWNPDKEALISILKEYDGVVSRAARSLDVTPHTLKKKIDEDPELTELLNSYRKGFEIKLLDKAENCVINTIENMENDRTNALKASMFTLNAKGKSRNWNNTLESLTNSVNMVDYENQKMIIAGQQAKIKELEEKINRQESGSGGCYAPKDM